MTTSIKIVNNGPGRVRVRHRDISLSARGSDKDAGERILAKGEELDYACVWGNDRKLIVEEVIEDDDKALGRR